MNNITTEEGSEGCLICFSKFGNYDVLPDQESQKIINNCWNYLHEKIVNSNLETGKSFDENQIPLCKICFDAASELIKISEQMTNCEKQILNLSFEFSLGVLARRTQAESINNKSDDSPKELIVLDVSRISPSLCSMDQIIPIKTEDFEYPCANSFVEEMDTVFNVSQDPLEIVNIVKHEFNEYYDDNSQTQVKVLQCPEQTANVNRLVKAEDVQDGVAINNMTRNYPATRSDMELINNISITPQTDDSRSAGSDRPKTNATKELPTCTKHVIMLTEVKESRVSNAAFNLIDSPEKPSLKHPLRNNSPNNKSGQPTTSSESSHITLGKTGSGNLKKVSISGSSLEVHERVGNGQTNYKCYFCEKVLSAPWILEGHLRIHTGEKPFQCNVCEKEFREMKNLKKHEMIHGEKLYKCSFCVKAFTCSSQVKRHEIIHTRVKPFKCSLCGKAFSQRGSLKRHEMIHKGEKPFKCSFCLKAFTRSSHVKRHEGIHTRVKPFKCAYCGEAFNHLGDAKAHETIHSNEINHLNIR